MKYRAIKLTGLNHWIWFKEENITETDLGEFFGRGGWGKGGDHTNVDTPQSLIEASIYSDTLQYV